MPITAITHALGISRPTVYVYLRRDTPPDPKQPQFRPPAQVLTRYKAYLNRRCQKSGAQRSMFRSMMA